MLLRALHILYALLSHDLFPVCFRNCTLVLVQMFWQDSILHFHPFALGMRVHVNDVIIAILFLVFDRYVIKMSFHRSWQYFRVSCVCVCVPPSVDYLKLFLVLHHSKK